MTRIKVQKKYIKIGIIALVVILFAILFGHMLENENKFQEWKTTCYHATFPIVAGSVLAYLLNPVLNFFERKIFLPFSKKVYKKNEMKQKNFSRACGVVCTLVVFFVLLISAIYMIAPQIYQSIVTIVTEAPTYYDNVNSWFLKLSEDNPELKEYLIPSLEKVYNQGLSYVSKEILPNMDKIFSVVTSGIVDGLKILLNVIVSVIVSVYVLTEKETLISVGKKLTYSLFRRENANAILKGVRYANQVFGGFISGKIIDSFIIGLLCYAFMSLTGFRYPLLISMVIGITNVIPYFGPFIGAIPCSLILLVVDYKQGLLFAVFILILQQIDGNIIGPLILGDRLKISSMWILFAILIGGGFFGVPGMVLGTPCFACIYALVSTFCKGRLQEKQLPVDSSEYYSVDQISPVNGEIVRFGEVHNTDIEGESVISKEKN